MDKYSIRQYMLLSIAAIMFVAVLTSCNGTKSASVYGIKWTGLIRTPLVPPYQTPGSPPYSIKEDINFSGSFSELKGDISKNNFGLESNSLRITSDKPGTNETWKDIWYSYSDSGVKSDGSREVYITGRCFLTNKKLNTIHPTGSLDYNLRLVVVPNKPYHFVMNVLTTKKGTSSDLMVSGNATPPNGNITIFPVK